MRSPLKAQDLVDKVQTYAKEHDVSARAACDKLGLNERNYYAATVRLKQKKKAKAVVAASKRAAPVAVPTTADGSVPVPFPTVVHKAQRTFLVVGDALAVAEIARALK